VSAEYVQHALSGLAKHTDPGAHTIWVHFGVDGTASSFNLEVGWLLRLCCFLRKADSGHIAMRTSLQSIYTFKLYLPQNHVFMPVPAQRQAFNQADFRVPDEAGWQPHHEAIDSSHSLNHTLRSTLPLDELAGGDCGQSGYMHDLCGSGATRGTPCQCGCVICHPDLLNLHLYMLCRGSGKARCAREL
jgi:hypothetical protein